MKIAPPCCSRLPDGGLARLVHPFQDLGRAHSVHRQDAVRYYGKGACEARSKTAIMCISTSCRFSEGQDGPQEKEVPGGFEKIQYPSAGEGRGLHRRATPRDARQRLLLRFSLYRNSEKDKTPLGTPTHKVIYDEIIPQGHFFRDGVSRGER